MSPPRLRPRGAPAPDDLRPPLAHRILTGGLALLVLVLLAAGLYLGWRRSQPRPRSSAAVPPSSERARPRPGSRALGAGLPDAGVPAVPAARGLRRPPSGADRLLALRLRAEARRDRDANRPLPCLRKLDRADRLDPDPEGQWAYLRAICEIQAGSCKAGQQRLLGLLKKSHPTRSPERLRRQAEELTDRWCPVDQGPLPDRVRRLARLVPRLRRLGHLKACRERAQHLAALWKQIKPHARGPLRPLVHNALVEAARCTGWLGHCAEAWSLWRKAFHRKYAGTLPPAHVERMARTAFPAGVRGCEFPAARAAHRPAGLRGPRPVGNPRGARPARRPRGG